MNDYLWPDVSTDRLATRVEHELAIRYPCKGIDRVTYADGMAVIIVVHDSNVSSRAVGLVVEDTHASIPRWRVLTGNDNTMVTTPPMREMLAYRCALASI